MPIRIPRGNIQCGTQGEVSKGEGDHWGPRFKLTYLSLSYIKDSTYALINPVTDYVARKKFSIDIESGWEDLREDDWNQRGDLFVRLLFGEKRISMITRKLALKRLF